MLSINQLLACRIARFACVLSCYADNWSYATQQIAQHGYIIAELTLVVEALRLLIDREKTWTWSNGPAHQRHLKQISDQFLPPQCELQHIPNARELGFQIHYRRKQSRKTQRERHELTLERLQRLERLDVDLHSKAIMIRTACLTKALFGTELYASGQSFFKQLRTAIARALVGRYKNTQPFLACMFLSKHVIDPELFTIQQAMSTARSFLLTVDAPMRNRFLEIAATSAVRPGQITGPAAALSHYLE